MGVFQQPAGSFERPRVEVCNPHAIDFIKREETLRLAGIQIACSEEKERNVEKALSYATIAIEKGAQIICFQELYTTYWFPKEINKRHFDLAETLAGPSIQAMRQLAIRHEVVLICPIFEAAEEKRFYNSAVVIDAGGEILEAIVRCMSPRSHSGRAVLFHTRGSGVPGF